MAEPDWMEAIEMRLSSLSLLTSVGLAVLSACETTTTRVEEIPDDTPATDAGFDSKPPAESGLGTLTFRPDTLHSGFDGSHTFKVPIAVYDAASDLTVTADDAASVTITPTALEKPTGPDGTTDSGKYFMITVKKAGTITLTAKSGKSSATATINVVEYASERWGIGEKRYNNAVVGGDPIKGKACADCHQQGEQIDHSPAALATADDGKVSTVIKSGISTAGFPMTRVEGGHKWEATDPERDGLITYLRALEPRGFK